MITKFKLYEIHIGNETDWKKKIIEDINIILEYQEFGVEEEFDIYNELKISDSIIYNDDNESELIDIFYGGVLYRKNNGYDYSVYEGVLENVNFEDLKRIKESLLLFLYNHDAFFNKSYYNKKFDNEDEYKKFLRYINIIDENKQIVDKSKFPSDYNDYKKSQTIKKFKI